jgi:tRNA(Ile)-lysidine synthase
MPVSNLVKKVQNTAFQHNLFQKNSKIILAVSGGPDSACLIDVFSRLQRKYFLSLHVAHVNYGLRGKDSATDEKFVRELCQKYKIEISVLRPLISRSNNLENRLRDIRYDFFEKIRNDRDFDIIAVAHNLDDQVETFLMRLIRGSGLKGLSGIKYTNGHIIRPLLAISKNEILKYLKLNKLKYRTDKTNLESIFARNKIRNQLIPFISKNFNPNIRKTISNSLENISEDNDYLSKLAKKALEQNPKLAIGKLLQLNTAILKRVLLLAIDHKKKNSKDISSAHIREIIKVLKSTKNKAQIVSFKGLNISRKGDRVIVEKN